MPAFPVPHHAPDGSSPAPEQPQNFWDHEKLVDASVSPLSVLAFVVLGVALITFVYRRRVRASLTCLIMQALERANLQTLHIHVHAQDYSPVASSAPEDDASDLECSTRELPPPYIPNARGPSISNGRSQFPTSAPLSITVPTHQSAIQVEAMRTPPTPLTSFSLSSEPSTPGLSDCDVSSPTSDTSSIETPKSSPCGFGFESPKFSGSPLKTFSNLKKEPLVRSSRPPPLSNMPQGFSAENSLVSIPLSPTVTISIHTTTTASPVKQRFTSTPPPNIVLTSVPKRIVPQTPTSPPHFLSVPPRHAPKRSVTSPVAPTQSRRSTTAARPRIPPAPKQKAPVAPTKVKRIPPPPSPPKRSQTLPGPRRPVPPAKPVLPDDFEAVYPNLDKETGEISPVETEKPRSWPAAEESQFAYNEKKSFVDQFAPWNSSLPVEKEKPIEDEEPETPNSASVFFSKLLDKSKELKEKTVRRSNSWQETSLQAPPSQGSSSSGFFGFKNKLGALAAKAVSAIEKELDSSDEDGEGERQRENMQARLEERRKFARNMFGQSSTRHHQAAVPVRPVVPVQIERPSMFVIGDEDD